MKITPIPALKILERNQPLPSLAEVLRETPLPFLPITPTPPSEATKETLPPLNYTPLQTPPSFPSTQNRINTPIPPMNPIAREVVAAMEESDPLLAIPATPKTPSTPQLTPQSLAPLETLKKTSPKPLQSKSPDLTSKTSERIIQTENTEDDDPAPLPEAIHTTPSSPAKPFIPPSTASTPSEDHRNLGLILQPIIENSLEKALYGPTTGLHIYLEPMIRSTIRRAIAEQMETKCHFDKISPTDKIAWRLNALFTSRTFDDIVFERTKRYQVEEVYLARYHSHSLISYASHDPSRHINQRRVHPDFKQLCIDAQSVPGELQASFPLPDKRIALVREGKHCFMIAVLRGTPNTLVHTDLDYALEQIEKRFEKRLSQENQDFLHPLQPILESCLLIQSPPAPNQ